MELNSKILLDRPILCSGSLNSFNIFFDTCSAYFTYLYENKIITEIECKNLLEKIDEIRNNITILKFDEIIQNFVNDTRSFLKNIYKIHNSLSSEKLVNDWKLLIKNNLSIEYGYHLECSESNHHWCLTNKNAFPTLYIHMTCLIENYKYELSNKQTYEHWGN
jgi:hypothetical protein